MIPLIVYLVQEMVTKPTRPESVWPVSVFGWVAGVSGLMALIIALRKANNGPILQEMKRLEEKMDSTVERLEKEFRETVLRVEREMTSKVNGLGRRVTQAQNDTDRNFDAIGVQANELVRSVEDRKRLNERMAQSESRYEAMFGMIQNVERGLRDRMDQQGKDFNLALGAQTDKIMDAIHDIRRPS